MARASARRSQNVGARASRPGSARDDREWEHAEREEQERGVDRELRAGAAPAHPVRVHVAGQKDGLEEEDAGGPGGRRPSDPGQQHLRDHRLDDEQEAGTKEDGGGPEPAHQCGASSGSSGLLRRPERLGHVLEVHADARPGRGAAAHRVHEHVGGLRGGRRPRDGAPSSARARRARLPSCAARPISTSGFVGTRRPVAARLAPSFATAATRGGSPGCFA